MHIYYHFKYFKNSRPKSRRPPEKREENGFDYFDNENTVNGYNMDLNANQQHDNCEENSNLLYNQEDEIVDEEDENEEETEDNDFEGFS